MFELFLLVTGCLVLSGGNTIRSASSQEPSGRIDWGENKSGVSAEAFTVITVRAAGAWIRAEAVGTQRKGRGQSCFGGNQLDSGSV